MSKHTFFLLSILLVGFGCFVSEPEPITSPQPTESEEIFKPPAKPAVVLPTEYNASYKRFGEYFEDRFRGYHVGDDLEFDPIDLAMHDVEEVPVVAIADGVVSFVSSVSGYGGVIIVTHDIDGKKIQALYGHVDVASTNLRTGDAVTQGQFLVNLGEDKSEETDGERMHLHFALWEGEDVRLAGYVNTPSELDAWINPFDFFVKHGALPAPDSMGFITYGIVPEMKKFFASLNFDFPDGWDVEYIPSIDALNLYQVSGTGSARARSQILIRYFDANDFLTLSSVNIYSTKELTVGRESYLARQYDIEKKSDVADFQDQPSWRNERHIVTDFRGSDGFTRYFVIAANPELDPNVYEEILASMAIATE